jgi:hypothetical protein
MASSTAVRVLLVAIARLDEAHRRPDNEFAAAGLLVTGGERTLPQQVKLILVETSFEAEFTRGARLQFTSGSAQGGNVTTRATVTPSGRRDT